MASTDMNPETKSDCKPQSFSPRVFVLGVGVLDSSEFCRVIMCGEKKFVGTSGIKTIALLRKIYCEFDQRIPLSVLRSTANTIRTIDINSEGAKGVRIVLNMLIEHTALEDRRRLFIWLRGRLGGRLGKDRIIRFSHHLDWRTRKEVARALKRLHAWAELRAMHEQEQHPIVRNMAKQSPARSFDQRLGDFCQRVAPRKNSSSFSRSLFVDQSVSFSITKPRPLEMIRALLRRISKSIKGT